MSHSEPWQPDDYRDRRGQKVYAIADRFRSEVVGAHWLLDEDNRRRIVACVNALAGIPTEILEAGQFHDKPPDDGKCLGVFVLLGKEHQGGGHGLFHSSEQQFTGE